MVRALGGWHPMGRLALPGHPEAPAGTPRRLGCQNGRAAVWHPKYSPRRERGPKFHAVMGTAPGSGFTVTSHLAMTLATDFVFQLNGWAFSFHWAIN